MKTIPPEIEGEILNAHARLLTELRATWSDLDALLSPLEALELPSACQSLQDSSETWLLGPLNAWRSARPLQRVLDALETYRRRRRELIGELPGAARARASDPAREILAGLLRQLELRQGPRFGALITLMGQASVELVAPWQLLRRNTLRAWAGLAGGQDPHTAHAAWKARVVNLRRRGAVLLEGLAAAPRFKLPRQTTAVSRLRMQEHRLEQRLAWWHRQAQAVTGALALEESLWQASCEIQRLTQAAVEQLHEERRRLLGEMEALIAWLEQISGAPPSRQTSLLTAEQAVARWIQEVEAAIRRLVPAQIEGVVRWKALPARRAPWRLVHPQRELLAALNHTALPLLLAAFRDAEIPHRVALQDMERARQVIAFSEELAGREGESGRAAAREALTNALLLLRHRSSSLPDMRRWLEDSAQRATAVALYKLHLKLDRDRFGLWGHLARQGIRQAVVAGRERFATAIMAAARLTQQAWRRSSRYLLARIGWEQPGARRLVHVERREALSQSLGLDLAPRGLPLIYQRLFRPEPVEDPRFLIGREAEMAAMADLRRLWEAGRPACALLVGERGGGKTSLINCALAQIFPDVEVVRTQFQERVWTASQMRRFLQQQVGLEPDRRAVVVLEELERAWLRCVGGYDALRELLGRIVLTSRHLLWVVAVNRAAFRLLNAVLGLESYFSHRINAASVEQRHLQEAILMRHNLTGLRLHFLPPQDARIKGRLRHRLGLQLSPQQIFFDALYRESEGLFRSAFELWLKHIERSQDGVLYVRPLERPNYDSLLSDLSLRELHTLQALLQHGSLTPEEHAQVFGLDPKASLDRLEILEDRELIEPDPGRTGFRVRPEAGRAVRVALYRRNLL